MLDTVAPVAARHFRRGSGTWATLAPVPARHFAGPEGSTSVSADATFFAVDVSSTDPEEALGACGARSRGTAVQGGLRSARRGDCDRGRPSLWGVSSDGARLAQAVSPTAASGPSPTRAPSRTRARTRCHRSSRPDRLDAPDHPGLGAAHDPLRARARRASPAARTLVDLSGPHPPRLDRARQAPAEDARTTSAGSARDPWSSGRWTSSAASTSPTAPSFRRSPVSTTTPATACVPASSCESDLAAGV